MSFESAIGIEDARVGSWLTELDPDRDPVQRVDVGWKMGDWDQMTIDEETLGLHWLKLDEWCVLSRSSCPKVEADAMEMDDRVPMVKRKLLVAWDKAGQDYRWDYHIDPNRTTSWLHNRADVRRPPS